MKAVFRGYDFYNLPRLHLAALYGTFNEGKGANQTSGLVLKRLQLKHPMAHQYFYSGGPIKEYTKISLLAMLEIIEAILALQKSTKQRNKDKNYLHQFVFVEA